MKQSDKNKINEKLKTAYLEMMDVLMIGREIDDKDVMNRANTITLMLENFNAYMHTRDPA